MSEDRKIVPVEEIVELLDANKINYARNFVNIERNGYDSDECQRFSYEIREDIEEILHLGFDNGGFTTDMKNAIFELTEIAVKLSAYKAVKKLNSYIKEKNKITDKFKNYKGEKNMVNVKDEVCKFIDDSILGVENLISQESIESLKESKNLLEKLKGKVNEVYDQASQKALEYAKAILGDEKNGLKAWREDAAKGIYGTYRIQKLFKIVEEWCTVKSIGKPVKEKDFESIKFKKDLFSRVSDMQDTIVDGDMFFRAIKDKIARTKNEMSGYRQTIRQMQADIAEKEKEMQILMDKKGRGEISIDEFLLEAQYLDNEIENKKLEKEHFDNALGVIQNNVFAGDRLINQIKALEFYYRFYQREQPVFFQVLFGPVNFRSFMDVLDNSIDQLAINNTLSYIDNILENIKNQTASRMQRDVLFSNQWNSYKATNNIQARTNSSQEDIENRKQQEADDIMKKYSSIANKSEPVSKNQSESDKIEEKNQKRSGNIDDIIF